MYREKSDADFQAADYWRKKILPNLLKEYETQIIFNTDETVLCYRILPEHTLMFKGEANYGSKK